MFKAALFVKAPKWKQPKCTTVKWKKKIKLPPIRTTEYCLSIRRNLVLTNASYLPDGEQTDLGLMEVWAQWPPGVHMTIWAHRCNAGAGPQLGVGCLLVFQS